MAEVTVLIPAHDEEDFIEEAVRSVVRQSARVLVLADACTDQTAVRARAAGADVLELNLKSKPHVLNTALAYVDTEYVALLDADGILTPGSIAHCVEMLKSRNLAGVCASVGQIETKGVFQRARAIEWAAVHRVARQVETWHNWVAVLSGMFGVYRTEALRDVNGWSSDGLCEDVDLAIKMNSRGHKCGFAPKAKVMVRDPDTFRVYSQQAHRWAAGWAQAIWKHKRLFFRRYGFTVIFGSILLDSILLISAYFSLAWHLLLERSGFDVVQWMGVWYVAMTVFSLGIATTQLGVKKAMTCYPAYVLVSTFSTMFSLWVMFREMILGRHLISWTGRQGRKPELVWRKRYKELYPQPQRGRHKAPKRGKVLGTNS